MYKLVSFLSLAALQILPSTAEVFLKPRFNNKFGQMLRVRFTNEGETLTSTNFLAIYNYRVDPVNSTTSILWSGMCGDQTSWDTDLCPPQERGIVTFGVKDPYQGSDGYFPLNTGKYKVCLMDGDDVPYTVHVCKIFKVKGIQKYVPDTTVTLSKNTFMFEESITLQTYSPAKLPNTWVAIYNATDVDDDSEELPDVYPWYWLYTGCNNQLGDQPESENCSKRTKRNDISFEESTQDGYYGYWPIYPGNYIVCLSYYVNSPLRRFSCSEEFTVEMPM